MVCLGQAQVPESLPPNSEPKRNQLEELFIWKVSEELKLSTHDEKKFTDTYRDLNHKKQILSLKIEMLTNKIIGAKTDSERKKFYSSYRRTLEEYSQLAVSEFDKMNGIFGDKKMAKYLEIKTQITNKVKALILSPDKVSQEKKPIPPPKIIQE